MKIANGHKRSSGQNGGKKIGMALHNTVAKQYLISLEAHTTEQAGLGYME